MGFFTSQVRNTHTFSATSKLKDRFDKKSIMETNELCYLKTKLKNIPLADVSSMVRVEDIHIQAR